MFSVWEIVTRSEHFIWSLMLLFAASVAAGQQRAISPTCPSGSVLQDKKGRPITFSSEEMKKRAIHKEDIGQTAKQIDISGTTVVDVLVDTSGKVTCIKTLHALPIAQMEVEKALLRWTFNPARAQGSPVSYWGRLQFSLCNISCGAQGASMTLLK